LESNFLLFVALLLGDGPAQKEVCGIIKGNCTHGCTFCEHNSLSNELYDSSLTQNRNFYVIESLCMETDTTLLKQFHNCLPLES